PPFVDLSDAVLDAIVTRHGLGPATWSPLPEVGIFNAIYALGHEYVLRVPRNHPHFIATARKEAIAVPAARAAGVRTPMIVVFDDSRELLPVRYTIYERIHGATLGLLDREPGETPDAWRALGRDLARLHAGVAEEGPIANIETEAIPDPRSWPAALAEQGYFTSMEARWLAGWLDRLALSALAPAPRRFVNNDVQATNVMVGVE